MIKAIETSYKGYRFRSRLEARWAVFFETLGLDWAYEVQGFDVAGGAYLPDFELRDRRGNIQYVEVKGDPNAIARDRHECERYAAFLSQCEAELVLLGDIPSAGNDVVFHRALSAKSGRFIRQWAGFSTRETPISLIWNGYLASACDLKPSKGCDPEDPEFWVFETRSIRLPRYHFLAPKAYEAARSARFEHGETPTPRT